MFPIRLAMFLILLLSCSWVARAADSKKAPDESTNQTRGKTGTKKQPRTTLATFTGCVDQRGDDYVLTGDEELQAIAVLEGDGFSNDNFARHMGHKVSIKGKVVDGSDPKKISVRTINDIADTCEPK